MQITSSPGVQVVHALPDRVHLRVPALAWHRQACEHVAHLLARELFCDRVSVRETTGSIVVHAANTPLDAAAIARRVAEIVSMERDENGRPLARRPASPPGPTRVAKAVAEAAGAINADVRAHLDDRADLGTVLPVVFAAGGLAEVAITGRMPVPSWFNLLWWSLRSFMTFNLDALEPELSRARGARAPDLESGGDDDDLIDLDEEDDDDG